MPLLDRCIFAATSAGTGDFVESAAAAGFQTMEAAGASNGATYSYAAQSADLSQWEVGIGTYTLSTTTLARTTVLFNSLGTTAKISFNAAPQVMLTALDRDITTINAAYVPGGISGQVLYSDANHILQQYAITGSGNVVLSTGATLVNPALGTPASATLTNATGLPISTGLTGAGTGVLTALGVNIGTAGAFVVNGGALGTPSSGTLTNATGLPISGIASLGTGVGAALGNAVNASGGLTTFGTDLPLAGGTLTGALVVSGASFGLSGNISAAAWTTSGVRYKNVAATLTDTSSSGTVATAYTDVWGGNTIAASSAVVFTNYYGAYFKAPVAGTNVTLTNAWALGADSINATTLYQGGTAIASTFAPLASPTFTGTVTGPDSGTWTSAGLNSIAALGVGGIAIAQGTITTNLKALNITATWNAVGTTFDAPLFMNVTNTASAAASLLADLQVGGSSVFNVNKGGAVFSANSGGFFVGTSETNGAIDITTYNAGILLKSTFFVGWALSTNLTPGQADTQLSRYGAGILGLSNSTNPTTFYGYNTVDSLTSPTNYERAVFGWGPTSNVLTIGTQAGGTGTLRNVSAISTWGFTTSLYAQPGTGYGVVLGNASTGGVQVEPTGSIGWAPSNFTVGTSVSLDTKITRAAAATFQFGGPNAASPVAQTLQVQSVVAGNANTAGVNWTFRGSLSNGSGASGALIFNVGGAGAASGSQNTALTGLTIYGATATTGNPSVVLGNAALATNATDGFLYVSSGAGTPTGTPTTQNSGSAIAMYIDTTNSQLWLYMGGAWRQPKTPAGAALVTWQ